MKEMSQEGGKYQHAKNKLCGSRAKKNSTLCKQIGCFGKGLRHGRPLCQVLRAHDPPKNGNSVKTASSVSTFNGGVLRDNICM
jgi:hypothetical protein